MHIINFLQGYWLDIVIVIGLILVIVLINRILVKYGKDRVVKNILKKLIIEAEEYLKTDTGKLKKEQVMAWFRTRYPLLSPLINDKNLDILIDKIVEALNEKGLSELTIVENKASTIVNKEAAKQVINVVDDVTKDLNKVSNKLREIAK
ncbi:MAG: hypothetical protein GX995_06355 [Clostridiales bacterium]|nr:hypothetical protein [Clostridiales bacterium]